VTARRRVLVVDDNAANSKLVAFLLSSRGYDVSTAINAEEALAAIATAVPDLILMDIQLPGMDGLALTSRLRADPRSSNIVIVALTAYAMKGDHEKAIAAGCDGYVTKPIDTRAFPQQVEQYLALAMSRQR
jgi:CheY-like chemotaxis protein